MPIPEDIVRVQIVFDLTAGDDPIDVAVTGFHMRWNQGEAEDIDWPAAMTYAAEGIRDRWVEHIPPGLFGNAVRGSVVKCYHLSTANLTLDEGAAAFTGDSAWRGSMSNPLPWENSLVLSLYGYGAGEFVPKRARRRGRMYLPPMGTSVIGNDQARVTTSVMADVVSFFGAFLNDVQGMHVTDTPGPTSEHWDLVVLSVAGNMATQIERFDAGNVMDTQRRRRNKQTEQRTGGLIQVSS